jgi:SnoaL-like domain
MEQRGLDQAEVSQWLDNARISRVVGSYFRALDEKHFDDSHFRQILASDAKVIRPNGAAVVGPANIADSHARSFARFEATQHLLTGHDVDIDGDTAAVRANLVAIHIWKDRPVEASMLESSFTAGGVITAALTRTPDGWRITRMENQVIWRTGFSGDMLQFSYDAQTPT